jgi:hypothetical protein
MTIDPVFDFALDINLARSSSDGSLLIRHDMGRDFMTYPLCDVHHRKTTRKWEHLEDGSALSSVVWSPPSATLASSTSPPIGQPAVPGFLQSQPLPDTGYRDHDTLNHSVTWSTVVHNPKIEGQPAGQLNPSCDV